jgi:uncharacterized membrane protein YccC
LNIFKNWRISALRAVALLATIGTIILSAKILHIENITWALISGVLSIELEIDLAYSVVFTRIVGTIIGASLASMLLITIGPNYLSLIIDVISITLICNNDIRFLKNSWKLATITSLIVLIAGLQQNSIHLGEIVAFQRAIEVIFGSLTAGFIIYIIRLFF